MYVSGRPEITGIDGQGFDELPVSWFHLRILLAGGAGLFTDGYALGSVSLALPGARQALDAGTGAVGLIAAAPLAGLLLGSLAAAPLIDALGRRRPFLWDMATFAALALAHYAAGGIAALVILRFAVGCVLGVDYVATKVYVSEFLPASARGRLMSWLSVAWVSGYTGAFAAGYGLLHTGLANPWRTMFASAVLPALLAFALRRNLPESIPWLVERGRRGRAGTAMQDRSRAASSPARRLFAGEQAIRTAGIVIFYTLHNVPYLVMTAFLPALLASMRLADPLTAGLLYDALLLSGSIAGLWLIGLLPRRAIAIGSLSFEGLCLAAMGLMQPSPLVSLSLLIAFGVALTAADSLTYVYPPEVFPTGLRASGVALVVAVSRLAATLTTQFFPEAMARLGTDDTLLCFGLTLLAGALFCVTALPETRHVSLLDGTVSQDGQNRESGR